MDVSKILTRILTVNERRLNSILERGEEFLAADARR
jgi:hypothetical protein